MAKKSEAIAIISLLFVVQLLVNPAIILPFNYGSAAEQSTIHNNSNGMAESNNTVYLGSSGISESTKQDTQILSNANASYANTTNLSTNQGHSEVPEIVTHGRYVYVIWLDDTNGNRDVFFKKSNDNGSTFGDIINLSNNPGGSLNTDIAVSERTGNVYVVWEHIPGNNGEIYYTRSTDNGTTFESPIGIGNNTGLNGFPQIIASEDSNNVYVVWHDARKGVLLKRSIDSGDTFESPISISDKTGDSLNPQIAISNDNVYVTWQSNPQGRNGQIIFSRSTDSGDTFESPISISKEDETNQNNRDKDKQKQNEDGEKQHILSFNPRIVKAKGTNDVYVIWHSGFIVRHVNYSVLLDTFFTKSTDDGATFESPISLSNYSVWVKSADNGYAFTSPPSLSNYSGWHLEPQLAISNDNVYVTWQSNPQGRNGQIIFSRSTDSGDTFESPISISNKSGDSLNPQLAISQDSNVYWVWNDNASGNEEIILLKQNPLNIHQISPTYNYKDTALQKNNAINSINIQPKNSKNIAYIERTFTDAAYDHSFYLFHKTNQSSNTTKYTSLLSSKVINQNSILPEHEVIVKHLKWLKPQSNITLLTDADAHETSSIFMDNGTNRYDLILLGHNEYVTKQEYYNLRQFVANGGTLILLDGNMFYVEVKYDKKNQIITLVNGHGWKFDGRTAWRSVAERWANETTTWAGSNYCQCWSDDIRFGNNPFGYVHNEEQYITNPDAKIILDYNAYNASKSKHLPRDFTIATYELDYKKGKVITLGLITTELLFHNDKFKRFFDSLLLYYVFGERINK